MAELYEQPKLYANRPAGVTPISGDPDLDKVLAELPPEEREMAMQKITAPPTGEEIAQAMQERNANGELFNMTLDQYRLYKAHQKNKEVDIISTFGQAASGIYDEITKAGESIVNDPANAIGKLTPSLIEAFAQGTRSLYGMAAQSADPSSVMFRMKNALSANGSDEEAEYSQFMEAQKFNVHSMNLMTGKETLVMDKDVINPEMTQVMSYVADPTLFIPFGGIAMKGARMVGMGEGLAKASARASMIRNKVLGGTLKWGVGAPIEFMGSAVRNTIDYGLERGSQAFEFATGMPAAEVRTTAQMYGWTSASAALSGQTIPLPMVGNVAGAMVGSTTARGVGEAIVALGDQIYKQSKHGRGVLSYAGQALRDTEKSGVVLSAHAKGLLRVIDMADPLFVYSADIAEGAGTGMVIGGGLGYLAGGEEGMASGAGAGFALGTVGAGLGSVTADVTNNRLYDRIAIQRKMVIEGLRGTDDVKATALEGLAMVGEMNAERTGNRRLQAEIDGMIAGIDIMTPNSKFNIRTEAEHKAWLESLKIDPKTGRLKETSAILPQFGSDRKQRATALSFLSMVSDNFSGLPENLRQHIDALPADHAMKKHWARLPDAVKKVVMDEVKQNANIEYRKQFGGKKANEFYGDINYAEAHTARINSLFDSGNPTQAKERINMLLKEETKGGKLTKRGELLKEKLATEGYFDKDGTMRPSRLKDVEMTEDVYKNVAGFVIRRDSTGQVEINLNLDQMGRDTAVHELFHAIMLESPMKDEFIDRLSTKLLGKFDANGKRLEGASVDTNQVKKFFQRYIDSLHRNNPTERANETTRLQRAIEEYEQRGDQNKVNRTTSTTLEDLVEEFGAFYFPKFIQDKPVDYLFRGGELGAMREMFQSVKFGWLDFWREKIGTRNPELNFDAVQGYAISKAFGKDGQPRYKNKALDLFMQDFVRATAMANRNGQFDLSRLSNDAQKTFVKNNGIRGYGTIDKDGKVVRLNRRTAVKEEMRVGKEIYKIVAGIDPKYRQSLTIDGEGNFSGRISPELAEELVKSGHVDRAWVDKLLRAYDIVDGKGSNVIEFGYLGRTAQIGDYAWPRLVGSDVPFKNRKAILLDVDFKIGKDGRMTALYHTLDHAVIEGRANTLWSDPAVRQLWDGDRGSMEADFFRYLSNASLPSDHPNRVSSAKLLEDGTGKGVMRRNALHQMLGMAKLDGDVYINKPIAEIPLGIRHSVTTFNIDGVSGLRVRQGARYDYNHRNAFRDLSRNFMMSEMDTENTPNGKIIKHTTGYKITKSAGTNKFSVFDPEGREVGKFDSLPDAGRAAQKDYNAKFDAKVEGKDLPVPRTEIPSSRQAFIDREFVNELPQEKLNEIKDMIVSRLNERIEIGDYRRGTDESTYRADISRLEDEGLTHKNIKDFAEHEIEVKEKTGLKRTILQSVEDYVDFVELEKKAASKYDNMYPMEIKSALHGRLAQIMQDYPNLTAQGLLKKLDVYGSQGYRYLQEATEIGLVDLLKSKIKPTTEIYRKFDAQGNPTGEVVQRELPVLFREIKVDVKDAEGNVLTDENGYPIKETRQTNENIQGTQPVLDMQEILDFAKSKEIKVTIEEGAREVNRMNTEQLTLGGDKSNYKETAIRINPEYAHGIRGHYGENTIVHFRTTERLDAEGNKVLFIEEVQANNTDIESKQTRYTEAEVKVQEDLVKVRKNILKELKQAGVFVYANEYLVNQREAILSSDNQSTTELRTVVRDAVRKEITGTGFDFAMDRDRVKNKFYDDIFEVFESTRADDYREIFDDLNERFIDEQEYNIWQNIKQSKHLKDIAKRLADHNSREKEAFTRLEKEKDASGIELYQLKDPNRLKELIEDAETRSRQMRNSMAQEEKTYPLTQAKDWTLTALKGIIRQAIRDGLDTITLTHPDDSPTVSHMKEKARRGLYGKTIPEVWGSWLRKYGIEISQQNRLVDIDIDKQSAMMAKVSDKIAVASEKMVKHFEQVGFGENPDVIRRVTELLIKPVHEFDAESNKKVGQIIFSEIKDDTLGKLIHEVKILKKKEREHYDAIDVIRKEGVKGFSDKNSVKNTDIKKSAEAIDRGMTFKLNDAIKQDFLSGNVKTHAMPTEGESMYQGGRTYNQNSKKWKSGFIGLWAEENPDRLKGYNIEFFQKEAGAYRIRLQDNSVKGRTVDVGHITAVVSGDTATISSKIANEYQGNKLSYALYSEMAERLRAMGIRRVDGQIVNRDGVPIRVRERIIGDTRDYFSGKPIDQVEGARRIREKQEMVGDMGGVDVYNELYPNARYMMSEGTDWSKSIADAQRDKPENAMVKVQYKLGGGAMPIVIEHAGDILHRTYERINVNNGSFGYETVKYKVDLVLKRISDLLLNKDEFRREVVSNFANDKRSTGTSEQHLVEVKKLLKEFGDAHAELPANNELQRRVKALNVALGNLDFNSAHRELNFLRTKLVNEKTWTDFASEEMSRSKPNTGRQMPAEYQGGDDYYKQSANPFESKDEQGLKIRKARIVTDERLKYNPENISWVEIGHYFGWGKTKDVTIFNEMAIRKNSGLWAMNLDDGKFSKINPFTEKERAKPLLKPTGGEDFRDLTHALWLDASPEWKKDYNDKAIGRYELPLYKRGELVRRGKVTISVKRRDYATVSTLNELKTKVSKNLDIPRDDFDMYYFDQNEEVKNAFGLSKKDELPVKFQPAEGEMEGGRTYDFNSPKFKSSFIGKYAEENPERLQNKNLEFVKRRDGSYRITMTDNSGATKKIGHITADLDMSVKGEGIAVISSNIDKKFRGNKLANVLYSEMAERLRAMGVKYVDGTIVNPEGIPVQVRNSVIGQTYYKGSNKPALREDAAKKIQAIQSIYPSKGIEVYNELDFNARYQPAEGTDWSTEQAIKARENQPMKLWSYPDTANFKKWTERLKFISNEEDANKSVSYDKGFVTTVYKGVNKRTFDRFSERSVVDPNERSLKTDPNFFIADKTAADVYAGKDLDVENLNEDAKKAASKGQSDMYYIKSKKPANLLSAHQLQQKNYKLFEAVNEFWKKNIKEDGHDVLDPRSSIDRFLLEIAMGDWLSPRGDTNRRLKESWRMDNWIDFHEHLLSKGYDSIVIFDNSVSKKAPTIIVPQETASVKASSNYGNFSKTDTRINFQPAEGSRYEGGDDYWKPKKNIFESRDEQGLLVRRISVGNEEITGNPDAVGSKTNPDYVGWEDIGHYPQAGETMADNIWEAKNSGLWYWKDDKGIKTKNPMAEMDRPDFTHSEWFDKAFKYEDDKPTIYGRYEKPKYDKKGKLIEKGRISISSNYRGEIKDMADANFYKETVASSLGVSADHIDAYLFGASDKVKASMGYGLKDQLAIKFQPAEGWRDWQSERTSVGSVIKNTAGYLIMVQRGKFKVYNPAKAIIGIYDNEDQAKRRVQKDEPRQ